MSSEPGDIHLTAKRRLLKQCAYLKSQEQAIFDRISATTHRQHEIPELLCFTIGRASQPQISVPTAALHDIGPEVLRRYLRWLAITKVLGSFEELSGRTSHPLRNSCTWAQCRHLIDSYILGVRAHDSEYQRHILQELDRWLLREPKADVEVLELVMRRKELGSQLRDFVIERTFCDGESVGDILELLLVKRSKNESHQRTSHRRVVSDETPELPPGPRDPNAQRTNGTPFNDPYPRECPYSKPLPELPPEAPSSMNPTHTIAACDLGQVRREIAAELVSLRSVRSRSTGLVPTVSEYIPE